MPSPSEISKFVLVYEGEGDRILPVKVYQRKIDDHLMVTGVGLAAQFKEIDVARSAMTLYEAFQRNGRLSIDAAVDRLVET